MGDILVKPHFRQHVCDKPVLSEQLLVTWGISLTIWRPTERLSAVRKAVVVLALFSLIPVGVLYVPEIGLMSRAVTSQMPREFGSCGTTRRPSATTSLPCGIGRPVGGGRIDRTSAL